MPALVPGGPTLIPEPSAAVLAVCRCETWRCDDLELTPDDVTVWELSWSKLGRALCRALELDPKLADLGVPNTRQIGSWSTEAVPVFLAIHTDHREFRSGLAELVGRLRRPFILLAPTSAHLDAAGQELLEHGGAGFFDLATHLRLTLRGTLQPSLAPGELFRRFQPQPGAMLAEDAARQAFALVRQLESDPGRTRRPSALTVFRLYCMDELSAEAVARRCGCAKATVLNRLERLRRLTGSEPRALRRLSPHLAKIEDELREPRARHIHRSSLIEEEETEER